jgi:hypothetical protein
MEIVFICSTLLHVSAAAETWRRVFHIKTISVHFVGSIIIFYTYLINSWIMDHVKGTENKMETVSMKI